ncbi:unnamed protein product [Diatraea saccharalis]|uniref:Chitin-binding type-2 domain-containing protein n=1 Tax=Diatraea saccharalis TaxID=40085 RepID=A0A9N9W755_9NEOP|nr:unnamed protein product [Diatraea saccharalis]
MITYFRTIFLGAPLRTLQPEFCFVTEPARSTTDCPHQYGFYPSLTKTGPADCGAYRMCIEGVSSEMTCPVGLAFNSELSRCDWPDLVPSCDADAYLGFKCPDAPLDTNGKPKIVNYKCPWATVITYHQVIHPQPFKKLPLPRSSFTDVTKPTSKPIDIQNFRESIETKSQEPLSTIAPLPNKNINISHLGSQSVSLPLGQQLIASKSDTPASVAPTDIINQEKQVKEYEVTTNDPTQVDVPQMKIVEYYVPELIKKLQPLKEKYYKSNILSKTVDRTVQSANEKHEINFINKKEPEVINERDPTDFVSAKQSKILINPENVEQSEHQINQLRNIPTLPSPTIIPQYTYTQQYSTPVGNRQRIRQRFSPTIRQPLISYKSNKLEPITPIRRTVQSATTEQKPGDLNSIQLFDYKCQNVNGYYGIQNECVNYIEYDLQPSAACPSPFGLFPIFDDDCSTYTMCYEGKANIMNCPQGLVFNNEESACDWPINVPSCKPKVFRGFTCPAVPEDDDVDMIYKYK